MSLDFSQASAALQLIIKNHLAGMVDAIEQEDLPIIQALSEEATRYGLLAFQGNAEAQTNLRHLEAQVMSFAARRAMQEQGRFVDSLYSALKIGGEVLGVLLGAAIGAIRPV